MTIRFGVSPIAWINDDMPELGGDTPIENVLRDIQEVGFSGVELGGKFPRDHAVLRQLLAQYGLVLVGGWYSSNLLNWSAASEIEAMRDHLALLKALGCSVFVIAETSNAVHGHRATPLSQSPSLGTAGWKQFGSRMDEVASFIAGEGLELAYHHHLGTVVETNEELERLLESTGDLVGLTLDTGHAALGGIDTLKILETVPKRVKHVHCKDVRRDVFNAITSSDRSFLDGVLSGMFTVPGDGDLSFSPVFEALSDMRYSGWVIVEAEQDPALADPRTYAQLGIDTLRAAATSAGLKEAA